MAHIQELEDAVTATESWVNALAERIGWRNRRKAYQALVTTLHALRDYLPTGEAVYLAAQLPPLLRGIYYEGWHPTGHPFPIENRSEFLDRIQEGMHRDPAIDAERIARDVLAELARHLPSGELEDAKAATPKPLRALWPG